MTTYRISILTINPHEFEEFHDRTGEQVADAIDQLADPAGVLALAVTETRTRYLPSRHVLRLDVTTIL